MSGIKELILECESLKKDNKQLLRKVISLEKRVEELLKEDQSLKF